MLWKVICFPVSLSQVAKYYGVTQKHFPFDFESKSCGTDMILKNWKKYTSKKITLILGICDLYAALEAEPSDDNFKSPEEFQRRARMWAKLFKEVHFDEDITPYIHG